MKHRKRRGLALLMALAVILSSNAETVLWAYAAGTTVDETNLDMEYQTETLEVQSETETLEAETETAAVETESSSAEMESETMTEPQDETESKQEAQETESERVIHSEAFAEERTVDDIIISVTAPKGVLPAGAQLAVKKIDDAKTIAQIEQVVQESLAEQEGDTGLISTTSFDITIHDEDGAEVQPDLAFGEVSVSFKNIETTYEGKIEKQLEVYHVDIEEETATAVDTTVEAESGQVEAMVQHFSIYTLTETANGNISNSTAANTTLKDTYVYNVPNNTTITATAAGQSGLVVSSGTVVLHIPAGVTLSVSGAPAGGRTGAGAGIRLYSGATLIVAGEGKLVATGGRAANGSNGQTGDKGYDNGSNYYQGGSANKGNGGNGGGGAGAGIGGVGGTGGLAAENTYKATSMSLTTSITGKDGLAGGNGGNGTTMGILYVVDKVTVQATAGAAGSAGTRGSGGARYLSTPTEVKGTMAIAGGGGGGAGGGGLAAATIGGGGGGGGAGGGGGYGQITNYWSSTNSVYDQPGSGGSGGAPLGAGGAYGASSTNRANAGKQATATTGGEATGQFSPGTSGAYETTGGSGAKGGNIGTGGSGGTIYVSSTASVSSVSGGSTGYGAGAAAGKNTTPSYNVTYSLTNLTSSGAAKVDKNAGYYAVLTAADGYLAPSTITVKIGGTTKTAGSHYTYTTDGRLGRIVIPYTQVTGAIQITAEGRMQTYTVFLDRQGGSGGTGSVTATCNSQLPGTVSVPSLTGYVFKGYFTSRNGSGAMIYDANGQRQNSIANYTDAAGNWIYTGAVSELSLHAYWELKSYTVELNKNEGSGGTNSIQVTYLQPFLQAIEIPTKGGYYFDGYKDDKGTLLFDSEGTPTSAVWTKDTPPYTLTAQWRATKYPTSLQNGSFEYPIATNWNQAFSHKTEGIYWKTTASDGMIELGRPSINVNSTYSAYKTKTASQGEQFAELNANVQGALYQTISTIPADSLYWGLDHRGRSGTDTMQVWIGSVDDVTKAVGQYSSGGNRVSKVNSTLLAKIKQSECVSGNTKWKNYTGSYTVPAGQTETMFAFVSVSAAGGNTSIGNLLDNIYFADTVPTTTYPLVVRSATGGVTNVYVDGELVGSTYGGNTVSIYPKQGQKVTLTDYPNEGYNAYGWMKNNSYQKQVTTSLTAGTDYTELLELTFLYAKRGTVIFEPNGGSYPMDEYTLDNTTNQSLKIQEPVKDGYTFSHWNSAASGKTVASGAVVKYRTEFKGAAVTSFLDVYSKDSDAAPAFSVSTDSGLVLVANYGPIDPLNYTIFLEMQGGTLNGLPDDELTAGDGGDNKVYVTLDPSQQTYVLETPERDEYMFTGWQVEGDTLTYDTGTEFEYTLDNYEASVAIDGGIPQRLTTTNNTITLNALWDKIQPDAPVIETQPSDVDLIYGYAAGSQVRVTAETPADGVTLGYQWYQSSDGTNTDGTAISGATSAVLDIDTGADAGEYYYYCVITADKASTGGTNTTTSAVSTVTVSPKVVELSWSKDQFTYDNIEKTVTATVTNAEAGDTVTVTSYTGNTETSVGDYTAEATTLSNANYTLSGATKTWTISPAVITVTAKDHTITYGDAPAANGFAYSEFAAGDDASVVTGTVTYTYSYEQYEDIGTYVITPVVTDLSADNYTFTGTAGELEVVALPAALSWSQDSFVYNGEERRITAAVTNAVNGDSVSVTGYSNNEKTAAGEYTAAATALSNANYTLQGANGSTKSWEIQKAEVTVTANPATITYGEQPSAAGVTYSGFASGEDETLVSGTVIFTYDYEQYDDIGTYQITPVISSLLADNYTFKAADGDLQVAPLPVVLSWSESSFQYDNTEKTVTATVTNAVNEDKVAVTAYTNNQKTAAGDYTAAATTLDNHNYTLTNATEVSKEWSITKKVITVTANADRITYGEEPAADGVEYSGFSIGDDEAVIGGNVSYTYDYQQYGDIGTYRITPVVSGLTADNYSFQAADGVLTVEPRPVALSWSQDQFTYDALTKTTTASVTDAVNGDSVTVTAYTNNEKTVAGSYTAAATALDNSNYTLTGSTGTTKEWTIGKAQITVTANTKTITYGEKPTAAGVAYSGFAGSDTADVITGTVTYTYDYAQFDDIGTYTITPVVGDLSALNYSFSVAGGDLNVVPKPVELTWSKDSLVYDSTEKSMTAEVVNAVNGDTVNVIDYTGNKQTAVNSYTAQATALDNSNYTLDGAVGNEKDWQITKKVITVTAKASTVIYGDAPEANGYTYSGIAVNDDESAITGTVTYQMDYAQYQDVGEYTITPVITDLSAENYSFRAAEGTLTVVPKPVVLSWSKDSFTYDGTAKNITAAVTNAVNNDVVKVTAYENDTRTVAGSDIASATALNNGNYTLSGGTGITKAWQVQKAAVTVTANDNQIVYGDVPAADGVTYTGFIGEDNSSLISGMVVYQYDYLRYGDAGAYTITPVVTNLSTENYSFQAETGELKVVPRPVVLNWSGSSFQYDGSTKSIHAAVTNAINGDVVTVTDYTNNRKTAAGKYTAKAAALDNSNYTLAEATGATQEWSITNRVITVTANPKTITYGETGKANGVTYSGFVSGDDSSVISGLITYEYDYTQYGDVGTYTITPVVTGLSAPNYSFAVKTGVLTVVPKPVALDWTKDSFTYDGTGKSITAAVTNAVNGDTVTVSQYDNNEKIVAGNYVASAQALDNENYTLTGAQGIRKTWTIKKRVVEVAAKEHTITYGDAPGAGGVTYTGLADGDTENEIAGVVTYSFDYAQYDDIGTYTILPEVNGLTADNYTFKAQSGVLTVTALPVILSWGQSRFTYDESEKMIAATVTNAVNGDLVTVTKYTGNKATEAGSYTAAAVQLDNANYTVAGGSDITKNWRIVKAVPDLSTDTSSVATAHDKVEFQYEYGGDGEVSAEVDNPAVTAEISDRENQEITVEIVDASALENGDMVNVKVRASEGENYESTEIEMQIIIYDAKIAVIANGYTGVYDGEHHGIVVTNTIPNTTVTYSLSTDSGYDGAMVTKRDVCETVVYYKVSGGELAEPYTGSTTIKIKQKALSITANNHTLVYGDAPAANGYTEEGRIESDTLASIIGDVGYDHSYKKNEPVGNYAITPKEASTAEANYENYKITWNAGTLTVTPKPITIDWATVGEPFTYDGSEKEISAAAGSLVDGDDVRLILTNNIAVGAGDYLATVTGLSGQDAANYTLQGVADTSKAWAIQKGAQTAPVVDAEDESVDGKHDGQITLVDTTMEYSDDGGVTWQEITQDMIDQGGITNLPPGNYEVRYKETDNHEASPSTEIIIGIGEAKDYTIEITAPLFDAERKGYKQPESKPLVITSLGNWDTTITSVVLDDDASFILSGSDNTVPEGGTLTGYMIQPKKGLGVGTYTVKVTVTYDDGAEATTEVTFQVLKATIAAPVVDGVDETFKGKNDGKLTGVKEGMEYSPDGGETWIAVTAEEAAAGEVSGLAPGEYLVRYAETDDTEASPAVTVTIGASDTEEETESETESETPAETESKNSGGGSSSGTKTNQKTTITTTKGSKTGDYSSLTLWLTLIILSGAVLLITIVVRQHKKE